MPQVETNQRESPVYSIVDVEVTDEERFNHYVQGHQPTLERYGGKFLVAGGKHEVIEGEWEPHLVVVHQWPNRAAFRAWYDSEEYRPWKEIRQASSRANVIVVDGLPPGLDPA